MSSGVSGNYDVLANHVERVHTAKSKLEREEATVIEEKEKIRRQSIRDVAEVNDRARKNVDLANRKGDEEVRTIKELNLMNIDSINQQHQKKMREIAEKTAKEVAETEKRSLQDLHAFQASRLDRLREMSSKAEDAFYRPKTFSTEINEEQDFYNIKVKLPAYEARDVSISGYQNQLRLSFNRAYEADTVINPAQTNRTRTHESITDTYYLPTNINFKNVSRNYAEGVLTIRVGKANPLQFQPLKMGEKADPTKASADGSPTNAKASS